MASCDREFSVDGVYAFLVENGGKATSGELARHFRKFLIVPGKEDENKTLFKEYVNSVAVQKRIGTENYVVLKSRMHDKFLLEKTAQQISENDLQPKLNSTDIEVGMVKLLAENIENDNNSESKTKVLDQTADKETEYLVTEDHSVVIQPVAPPRRKHTVVDKENRSSEESDVQVESQTELNEEPRIVSVKEQAQKLNKIASQSQLVLHPHNTTTTKKFHREMRFDRNFDDEDSSSVTSLDAQAKEWIVNAAKCNYQELSKLLKANPSLARQEDIASGYNALHWAAKHGNNNVIKLIAGTYKVPVNIRSHGGYTPLHIAAMFKNQESYDILVAYHANEDMRDFSGKKASDYLNPNKPRQPLNGSTYKDESSSKNPSEIPVRKKRRARRPRSTPLHHSDQTDGASRITSFQSFRHSYYRPSNVFKFQYSFRAPKTHHDAHLSHDIKSNETLANDNSAIEKQEMEENETVLEEKMAAEAVSDEAVIVSEKVEPVSHEVSDSSTV